MKNVKKNFGNDFQLITKAVNLLIEAGADVEFWSFIGRKNTDIPTTRVNEEFLTQVIQQVKAARIEYLKITKEEHNNIAVFLNRVTSNDLSYPEDKTYDTMSNDCKYRDYRTAQMTHNWSGLYDKSKISDKIYKLMTDLEIIFHLSYILSGYHSSLVDNCNTKWTRRPDASITNHVLQLHYDHHLKKLEKCLTIKDLKKIKIFKKIFDLILVENIKKLDWKNKLSGVKNTNEALKFFKPELRYNLEEVISLIKTERKKHIDAVYTKLEKLT